MLRFQDLVAIRSLSPKNKYTISAEYRLPLDESLGRISVGADLVHTDAEITASSNAGSPIFGQFAETTPTDLINVNMGWTSMFGTSVDMNVFGTNITDDHYISYISGIGAVAGFETAALGQPRMYGVSLTYHFGG